MSEPTETNQTQEQSSSAGRSDLGRFQISLTTMLLITLVFSVMSAGLFYASQIPEISDEFDSYVGTGGRSADSGRKFQLLFIMFTYSMPLIMAGILSTAAGLWNWWNRRR